MNTLSRALLSLSIFVASFCSFATPTQFTLDKNHTYVLWSINHLGFSSQSGKWYASGELTLDKDHPGQSKVNAMINMSDLSTGLPELDDHLKSPLFFDVKQFPIATFVSNEIKNTGKDTADVSGTLTLHGVSKPVVLHVKFNKAGMNPVTNRMSVGFTATATIKRSDFGMKALLPALGDEVQLMIGAEAFQSNQPSKYDNKSAE